MYKHKYGFDILFVEPAIKAAFDGVAFQSLKKAHIKIQKSDQNICTTTSNTGDFSHE